MREYNIMSDSKKAGGSVTWENETKEKYDFLLSRIPMALRATARRMVTPKAESFAQEDGRSTVCEKDLVDAFFAKIPSSFHTAMKTDMKDCNIDWTIYGHPQ